MINQSFYYKHFPNGVFDHTNVILKYAAEGPGDTVNYSSKLFIKIKVDGGIMVLKQPVLLVPNIRFDVYLGQTLISSESFFISIIIMQGLSLKLYVSIFNNSFKQHITMSIILLIKVQFGHNFS